MTDLNSPDIFSSLLRTKLQPPRMSSDVVKRTRIVDCLDMDEKTITLVSAPAGFGKSTIVTSWMSSCDREVAWISLDRNDNNLLRFGVYVIAAIHAVIPDQCHQTIAYLDGTMTPHPDELAVALINDVGDSSKEFVLVMDDFHIIADEEVLQFISFLIHAQPHQMHLVIISRSDPLLPLARLRVEYKLNEIRSRDLRFTESEAWEYLSSTLGQKIDRETAVSIHAKTEGWIVGLRLAAIAIQDGSQPKEQIIAFKGDTNRFVREYLTHEVLRGMPIEIQVFLYNTSILDQLHADLCEVVSELKPGQGKEFLEDLLRLNLFIIPIDEDKGWYRYHHLFQEMLLQSLIMRSTREERFDLHVRASQWFVDHGYIDQAIEHALKGDALDLAISLVESQNFGLLNRFDRSTIERWIDLLPQELVWERPIILIIQAMTLFRQYRITALETLLDRAEQALIEFKSNYPEPAASKIRGQIDALKSATSYLIQHDYRESIALHETALAQLPPTARDMRSMAEIFGAFSRQALGNHSSAVERLREITSDISPYGASKTQAFIGLCLIYFSIGQLSELEEVTNQFKTYASATEDINSTSGANYAAGFLQYERNDLNNAEESFQTVFDLRFRSNFVAGVTAACALARIFQCKGELDRAQKILDLIRVDAEKMHNTDLLTYVEATQAEQWLLGDKILLSMTWARTFHQPTLKDNLFIFDLPILTQTRILNRHGSQKQLQLQRQQLIKLAAELDSNNFLHRRVQTLAHLATLNLKLRSNEEARKNTATAIALSQSSGFIRSFVDAGPDLIPVLKELMDLGEASAYIGQILRSYDSKDPDDPDIRTSGEDTASQEQLINPLSPREIEVLELIETGMTNQEIAQELVISHHTVRTHTSNIYAKLGEKNRTRAIYRARALGILTS